LRVDLLGRTVDDDGGLRPAFLNRFVENGEVLVDVR